VEQEWKTGGTSLGWWLGGSDHLGGACWGLGKFTGTPARLCATSSRIERPRRRVAAPPRHRARGTRSMGEDESTGARARRQSDAAAPDGEGQSDALRRSWVDRARGWRGPLRWLPLARAWCRLRPGARWQRYHREPETAEPSWRCRRRASADCSAHVRIARGAMSVYVREQPWTRVGQRAMRAEGGSGGQDSSTTRVHQRPRETRSRPR